jgi:predicted glycosyltransferase
MDTPVSGPARALFYSADVTGLGNIRRTLAIVKEIAARRPDAALLGVTGSMVAQAFALPPSFDYVKLPSAARSELYQGLVRYQSDPGTRDGVWTLRERLIEQTAALFRPDLMLVDHAPAGIRREARKALLRLHESSRRPALVLGLRDVADRPERLRETWQRLDIYQLLDEVYDRILVYGDPEIIDPVADYQLSDAAAAKVTYCGYVRNPEPVNPPEPIRERLGATNAPLVVTTVGGGEGGGRLLRLYLQAARTNALTGIVSLVVVGPMVDGEVRRELQALADGVTGVQITPFVEDLPSVMNAADVVVTMGGLTLIEAVGLGKRVVSAPRAAIGDQAERAERFAAHGLVNLVPEEDCTPARLAAAVRESLASPPPTSRLPMEGASRAADVLVPLLP